MIINLDELNNSNTLFMHYVFGSEDFTSLEPATPQYRKLKGSQIVSLTLRITDQNGNVITEGLGTIVVLHIHNCKL